MSDYDKEVYDWVPRALGGVPASELSEPLQEALRLVGAVLDGGLPSAEHRHVGTSVLPAMVKALLRRCDVGGEDVPQVTMLMEDAMQAVLRYSDSGVYELWGEVLAPIFAEDAPFYTLVGYERSDMTVYQLTDDEAKAAAQIEERKASRDAQGNVYAFVPAAAWEAPAGLISALNVFGKMGGFDGVVRHVAGDAPLDAMRHMLGPIAAVQAYLLPDFLEDWVPRLVPALQTKLMELSSDELKVADESCIDDLKQCIQSLYLALPSHGNASGGGRTGGALVSPANKVLEAFTLDFGLKCLKAPILKLKLKGLADIRELVRLAAHKAEYISRLRDLSGQAAAYLANNREAMMASAQLMYVATSVDDLLAWLLQHDIVDLLYGSLAHMEVMRRGFEFVKFLASQGVLTKAHIDLIWEAGQGKHEAVQNIVLSAFTDLAPSLSLELLGYVYHAKVATVPHASFSSHLIQLVRALTMHALLTSSALKTTADVKAATAASAAKAAQLARDEAAATRAAADLATDTTNDSAAKDPVEARTAEAMAALAAQDAEAPTATAGVTDIHTAAAASSDMAIEAAAAASSAAAAAKAAQELAAAVPDSDYGLPLLWELLQDEAHLPESLAVQASTVLYELLGWQCGHVERAEYMERCIANLREHKSICATLQLLRKIVSTYSSGAGRGAVGGGEQVPDSMASVVAWLAEEHALLDVFFADLVHYKAAASAAAVAARASGADDDAINRSKLFGAQGHIVNIRERLQFLNTVLTMSDVGLNHEQVDALWESLVVSPTTVLEQEEAFRWLENTCAVPESFSYELVRYIFDVKARDLSFVSITLQGYRFYEYFFRYINWKEKRFEQSGTTHFSVLSLQLIGIDGLWRLAWEARDAEVGDAAYNILIRLYQGLVPSLRTHTQAKREELIERCIAALSAGAAVLLDGDRDADADADATLAAQLRISRALGLLKLYLDEFASIKGGPSPHGSLDRSAPLVLYVDVESARQAEASEGATLAPTVLARHKILVSLDDTLGDLRWRVGKLFSPTEPPYLVQLALDGELFPERCGLARDHGHRL
ncbi:uncharacterized protein AMSG_12028 [Thecamonas trahens ATCC 50062]|uniref:UBP34/UBP24/USP9X/USP9Y-like ARM repeat region domain-containing protein n=1 Tax=Thecamonas trahens ATCC 50062 TaxID=461836 RepID=A0A0L0DFD0_THETB|nr:hypothetical protein AMSG_12028 [Thecamonas trahens ATCC 50062]KNC51052.1 hypothetical protein AMSG_12028 [Thecamonas trahens ATCC 50062]|eukprot:XP_013756559.1 hypothetical protein AMSG_12028 [Thecamonas trahens ATCC 50062]